MVDIANMCNCGGVNSDNYIRGIIEFLIMNFSQGLLKNCKNVVCEFNVYVKIFVCLAI